MTCIKIRGMASPPSIAIIAAFKACFFTCKYANEEEKFGKESEECKGEYHGNKNGKVRRICYYQIMASVVTPPSLYEQE